MAPASYAALPRLAQIAAARPDVAVEPALFLFASIIASVDGPTPTDQVRVHAVSAISALVPVAEHKLDLVHDRTDVIYALQAVAAVENLPVWQRELDGLAGEELELECPACGVHVYLELLGQDLVATADPDQPHRGRPMRPADPARLPAPEARLIHLCLAHGHRSVAAELLQLFGHATCPHCNVPFTVADAYT